MATNSIFHTNNLTALKTEQNLYRDLIKEAIQIYGHDVYYIDRTTVAIDSILGEDALSKYTTQHPIEMYVEDGEGGYAGEKEIMSQFGLENRNEITFVVSKQRYQEMDSQISLEDGTDTTGGSILLEAGSINQSTASATLSTVTKSFIFNEDGDNIVLEDDNTTFLLSEESGNEFYILMDTATTDADRPQEGDLVFHPILEKMFQINFVDHDQPFHQLDNNPVYKLRCQQFEYSQERIDTGITEVDNIESELSVDIAQHQFTLEQSSAVNENIRIFHSANEEGLLLLDGTDSTGSNAGDNVTGEDDSSSVGTNILLENAADSGLDAYLLQETYIVGDRDNSSNIDNTAQNELFDTLDDNVLDFSEKNPFGDAGGT
tara:strand:+ start:476 stop:1600 length:1125 start_codon:yes stop_codon:yes gene_type:complete